MATYDARLDTLVQTRRQVGRWLRCGLWLLGACLSVPAVLGFLTLLPSGPLLSRTQSPGQPVGVPMRGPTASPPPPALSAVQPKPEETPNPQGQRGYKDFAWGDSIATVKSRVSDLVETTNYTMADAMYSAYLVQYGHLYEGLIPSPLTRVGGKTAMFHSQASDMTFAFLNGKLFAVAVSFDAENPLPTLEKKYGPTQARHWKNVQNGWGWTVRA
jgi:hypothetical protein